MSSVSLCCVRFFVGREESKVWRVGGEGGGLVKPLPRNDFQGRLREIGYKSERAL